MNKVQEDFLKLLRAGLWGGKPSLSSPLSLDEWDEILLLSIQQAVIGIVFDSISALPQNEKPDRVIILKWIPYILKIEKANQKLNKVVKDLSNKLNDEGIGTVLLKGQGIAQEYINPLRRNSGDIDLYICNGKIEEARSVLYKWDIPDISENEIHFGFKYEDVAIELHKSLIKWSVIPSIRNLGKWLIDKLDNDHIQKEGNYRIPDAEFNIIYEFYHMYNHFICGGVGFRQICDWCRCLHNANGEIDINALSCNLHRFGLLESWKAFGYVIYRYLGISQNEVPLLNINYSEEKSEKIIHYIFNRGNMGHNLNRKRSPYFLMSKLQGLCYNIKDVVVLFPLFPLDSLKNIKNPINLWWVIWREHKKAKYKL